LDRPRVGPLLLFGLGLSIPLVILASGFVGRLLDRYPLVEWAGVAVLGRVGSEMLVNDPLVAGWLAPGWWAVQTVGLAGAVAVVGFGLRARRRASARARL
jgi:predicted tellurium resistance membrane protein TerC